MRLLRPFLVLGAACTLVLSLSGQTVRVLSVTGEATLQSPGEDAPRALKRGDTIVVGTRIVTGENARIILTPLPGVNSIISPKSEVVIERVSVTPSTEGKAALHSAVLDLKTGAVTTDLKTTPGVDLDYGVRTARGLAGARGTTYTVGVNAAGIQTIVVADGKISLTLANGSIVSLVPGQVSITRPDGSTQAVNSAAELSTGDQAIADNWVETTLQALAEAVTQGIDIDPAALDDAIQAATGLGISVSPETTTRIEQARQTLEQRATERATQTQTRTNTETTPATEVVTEQSSGNEPGLRAFLATLTDAQRAAFALLGPSLQQAIASANDPVLTAFALALDEGGALLRPLNEIGYLTALGDTTLRSAFLARPADIQAALLSHPADNALAAFALQDLGEGTYRPLPEIVFFAALSDTQRPAYLALPKSTQDKLASAADPALTAFALAADRPVAEIHYAASLETGPRALFLTYPAALRTTLATAPTDTALAAFAYATNEGGGNLHSHAAIAYFAGLDAAERLIFSARSPQIQELAATDASFAGLALARDAANVATYSDATLAHYLLLAPSARPSYLARSAEVRDLFAAYGKPGLTTAATDPASFEGPPTDADLRRNLAALLDLSPENRALFETFAGGPAYPKLDGTPTPYTWSDTAWTRTRNSFASLSTTNRDRIIGFGATEGLFDYSGTFMEAALADYDATLDATTRDAIQSAGWTRYFADYFADETIRSSLAAAALFPPAELAVLREFDISPHAFAYFQPGDFNDGFAGITSLNDPKANLALLAARTPAERAILARLLSGNHILFAGQSTGPSEMTSSDYDQTLSNALAFAALLTPEQLDLVSLAGLGERLFNYQPDDPVYLSDTPVSAKDRLLEILSLFSGLDPARRDHALDTGLFESVSFDDFALTPANVQSALDAWASLSLATRDFLADNSDGDLNLLALAEDPDRYDALDSLLAALAPGELAVLRETRAGSALLETLEQEALPGLAEVQAFTSVITSLNDTQRFTLNELGITSEFNLRQGLFSAATDIEGTNNHPGLGFKRLLQAYSQLSGQLRAATRQVNTYDHGRSYVGPSFFFASDDGDDFTTYNIGFDSPSGDLHVGATRRLSLYGINYDTNVTFRVPDGKDIYLRASSLIELDSIAFSPGVRAITMEAVTINLASLDFPEGSVASLNSGLGGTGTNNKYPNFDGTSQVGRVNFINSVSYGGATMADEASFDAASRGNIAIGTLQNRAPLPAYTAPAPTLPE